MSKECILWQRCNFVGQRKFIDVVEEATASPIVPVGTATAGGRQPEALRGPRPAALGHAWLPAAAASESVGGLRRLRSEACDGGVR